MGSGEGDDYRAWHEYFSWLFSLATGHNEGDLPRFTRGDLPRFIDQVYTPREDLPADLPKAGPQSSKTYAFEVLWTLQFGISTPIDSLASTVGSEAILANNAMRLPAQTRCNEGVP